MAKEAMSTNRSCPSHEAVKDEENTFNTLLNKIQSYIPKNICRLVYMVHLQKVNTNYIGIWSVQTPVISGAII